MTDLQINVALAKAMGWDIDCPTNNQHCWMATLDDIVYCKDLSKCTWSKFDYRDPVIFVSICKHWQLVVNFEGWTSGVFEFDVIGNWCRECIEKSAAITVIELAKRGVK